MLQLTTAADPDLVRSREGLYSKYLLWFVMEASELMLDHHLEEIPAPAVELARQAEVSPQTQARMNDDQPVQRYTAVAVPKRSVSFWGEKFLFLRTGLG
ncbi:hypothetical protein KTAU_15280 [Thermogemmatispora aurantia]|uniref:Uncharacterized protein n=1 Tax=Thermogemmatispora aurantia TaxID=2045279 RepID=A0A5J4K886_9CHLR|nr:hypothetical protein KTAU_15280 [Thermogemmatispora aurantia]